MDELERRLHQAADETRDVATRSVAPEIGTEPRPAVPRWLAFAAGFTAVLAVIGAVAFLTPSVDPEVAAGTSTTVSQPVPTTMGAAPVTTSPTPACSAASMAVPDDQPGLPEPVADMRLAISEAAAACDFDTLRSLAGPELNTSFGGGGFDNIRRWEQEGTYPALALLVQMFDTSFAVQQIEEVDWYVWPAAFIYDDWAEIPRRDIDELLTVYTQEELDQIATFGSYAGWRIGITEAGDWRYFVAGD